MATLTINIHDSLSEALGPLDGILVADTISLAQIIRDAICKVSDELVQIGEEADEIRGEDLRAIARRLELLAGAVEA